MARWQQVCISALLMAVTSVITPACTAGTQAPSTPRKVSVVTTFYPLQYLAQYIGGDRVDVTALMPAGAEAHHFEPSPQDVANIQKAQLFIYNGAGLEPWAERIVATLKSGSPRIINASQPLQLLTGGANGRPDPHIWLDPQRYGQQANLAHDALLMIDPARAETYTANLNKLRAELDMLEREMKEGLAFCSRDTIVTSHAAFQYLAERFGLRQLAVAGLSPEGEPSPARMKEIVKKVRSAEATHIFFEPLASPAVAEAIARETGAQTLPLDPLEGLTQDQIRAGESYFTVMRRNLANLRIALACQ